ncbi:MAG: DNA-binding CsgD family transcriptional regulator [Halieaceae bacterium]|jgi:DNA-binding CsgD family transcriptional regulator
MSALALFSQHLAALIPGVGDSRFPHQLIEALKALVPVDDATILVYPAKSMPLIEYFEVPDKGHPSTLDRFIKGAFLLDPYYLAADRDHKFGVFRLRDLSPTGFKDSEYYKTWYRSCGYQDECGYIMPMQGGGFVNIALGKTRPGTRFSKAQFTLLEMIAPAVEALCRQHWQAHEGSAASQDVRAQLNNALVAFGSSMLTDRETQVINLVLHGHSTKTLAEKLCISMETVKLHRKHAYAKLEVSSQAELFYLFLDSVMSAKNYTGGDTLVAYMQSPPR